MDFAPNLDVESIKKLKVPVFDTEIAEMFVSQHEDEYLNGNMGWFKFNGTIWSSLESVGRHMRPSLVSLSRSYLNLIPALKYITKTLQMMTKGMSHLILVLGLMTTIVHQLPEEKRRRK